MVAIRLRMVLSSIYLYFTAVYLAQVCGLHVMRAFLVVQLVAQIDTGAFHRHITLGPTM